MVSSRSRVIAVLFALTPLLILQVVVVASAQAACPTSNGSYNNQRTGSIPAGSYEVRWRVSGITDAPCSKTRLIDQTGTQINCIEVSFDWNVGGAGHYDSRNFVNCHQNFWEMRVISERNADQDDAAGWDDIRSMSWMTICGRANDPGEELGDRINCSPVVGNVNPPNSPLMPTEFGEYWIWHANGTFDHLDPP